MIATGTTMWVGLSAMVVWAYFRRRRYVIALRAEQEAQEAADDAAARILAAEQAALQAQLDQISEPVQTATPSPDEKPTIH